MTRCHCTAALAGPCSCSCNIYTLQLHCVESRTIALSKGQSALKRIKNSGQSLMPSVIRHGTIESHRHGHRHSWVSRSFLFHLGSIAFWHTLCVLHLDVVAYQLCAVRATFYSQQSTAVDRTGRLHPHSQVDTTSHLGLHSRPLERRRLRDTTPVS